VRAPFTLNVSPTSYRLVSLFYHSSEIGGQRFPCQLKQAVPSPRNLCSTLERPPGERFFYLRVPFIAFHEVEKLMTQGLHQVSVNK
jgi:hypothetical protein